MSDPNPDDVRDSIDDLIAALLKAMAGDGSDEHEFLRQGCAFLRKLEAWMAEHDALLSQLSKIDGALQLTFPAKKAEEYLKQELELLKGLKLKRAAQDELEKHVREIFAKGLSANSVDRKTVLDALEKFRKLICKAEEFTAPATGGRLRKGLLKRVSKHIFQVVTIAGDSLAATAAFGGAAVGALPLVVAALAAVGSIGGATLALLEDLPDTRKSIDAAVETFGTNRRSTRQIERAKAIAKGARVDLTKKNKNRKL